MIYIYARYLLTEAEKSRNITILIKGISKIVNARGRKDVISNERICF